MPDYRWGIFLSRPRRRTAPSASATHIGRAGVAGGARRVPQAAAAHHRHAGRHRAGVGRAAAPARPDRAVALRPAQPVPGERRGGPAPVGDGLPAPPLLRPRRPRGGGGAARSAARGDADKPRILGAFNEPIDGLARRSSCSRCSPTATASSSSARSPSRASIRSRARRASCSPRKRTTCSWARPASSRVVQRTCEVMNEQKTDDPATPRALGGIDLPTHPAVPELLVQLTLDLFGGEVSSNAADVLRARAQGPLPRRRSAPRPPRSRARTTRCSTWHDGKLVEQEVRAQRA